MRQSATSEDAGGVAAPALGGDLEFAAAVLRKNRKATAEFVERYSDVLFGYLSNRLWPRTELAEDLLQDVFLTAWENLSRFEGRSSLRNWLLGIARHKVETHYRKLLKAPSSLDEEACEEAASGELPADDWLAGEQRQGRAREVLERLPERYRTALLWRYWDGRSAAEMAVRIPATEKAVERLLARARLAFRKEWGGE